MIMNTLIATFFIVIGTFTSLVTFIGILPNQTLKEYHYVLVISEYILFFLAVLGMFNLRRCETTVDLSRRTRTFNPIIYCIFSSCVVIKGGHHRPTSRFRPVCPRIG